MKFRVYNPCEVEEQEVFLKLEQFGKNVELLACNADGEPIPGGSILLITQEGTLGRFHCPSEDLGIQRDSEEKIKLEN